MNVLKNGVKVTDCIDWIKQPMSALASAYNPYLSHVCYKCFPSLCKNATDWNICTYDHRSLLRRVYGVAMYIGM